MTEQPTSARAVIIGGGIVGCSTAYHLAKLGWTDTVLVERHKLTSGSTFHAAGLVGQLRSSANITQLLGYSVDLYKRLEDETGQATGWKMNGGLRLACNDERWNEVKRQATTAKSFGLEMHLLSPSEAQELWPLMTVDDVIGAAFLPTDGQANPTDITMALAKRRTTGRRDDLRGHRGVVDRSDRRCDQGRRHFATDESNAASWCVVPVSGRARLPRRSASTFRWCRCSISTSSPRRSIRRVPRDLPTFAIPIG